MTTITAEEQQKYWAIFSGLSPTNGFLSGQAAGEVLAKSGLPDDKLADVWDRADIDNDGMLDFEEFCVAMRLIFDLMNGVYINVPPVLPDFLVPGSKQHLITANSALEHGLDMERPEYDDDEGDDQGLKSGFDWYMSPTDKRSYESIYTANADRRGGVKFDRLTELYSTLAVPDREIQSAWTLVNPKLSDAIGKDQTLVFLHILNQRHQGMRIPKNVPASLRATFQKSEISYNTAKYDKDGNPRSKSGANGGQGASGGSGSGNNKGQEFGGTYLSKLGVSTTRSVRPDVDNSKDVKDGDWEFARLQRELKDIDTQLRDAQSAAADGRGGSGAGSGVGAGRNVLVRRELEQLLDFKKSELGRLDAITGSSAGSSGAGSSGITNGPGGLASVKEDIDMFKAQLDALTTYLSDRTAVLQGLENEKRGLLGVK